jgi:hypothetical protein
MPGPVGAGGLAPGQTDAARPAHRTRLRRRPFYGPLSLRLLLFAAHPQAWETNPVRTSGCRPTN